MDEHTLLQQGIAAVRAGQKAQARKLLTQVVNLNRYNELAWLWLGGVMDSPAGQVQCLGNVLSINPDNAAARKGLAQLQAQTAPPLMEHPTSPTNSASQTVTPTADVHCPSCGGTNRPEARFCSACGQGLNQKDPPVVPVRSAPPPPSYRPIPTTDSGPVIPARAPTRPAPSYIWRLPGVIGAAVVIFAGVLPWGSASWLLSPTRTFIGLSNDYGVWSTGLAVVALLLLLAIRHNRLAHIVALVPMGGTLIAATSAMDNVAEITTHYSMSQDVAVGPYVVILGEVLMGVSFLLAVLQELAPRSAQEPPVDYSRVRVGVSADDVETMPRQKDQAGLAVASMLIGSLSLLAALIPICGFPIAITGLVLGRMSRNSSKRGMSTAGIVMSCLGLAFTIFNGVAGAYLGSTGQLY